MPDDQTKPGDRIRVGNITGSTGVGIGRQVNVTVNQGADAQAMARTFAEIMARLDALQGADAKDAVGEIQQTLSQGQAVEEGWLARRFRNIARMGPGILDVVTAALLNPAAGVATAVRKIAAKARADAGLAPVATDR